MISEDRVGSIDMGKDQVLRHIFPSSVEMMKGVFHLCEKNQLFNHFLIPTTIHTDTKNNLTFEHERVPFVTFPYEWSPLMYRDAGLFILDLLETLRPLNLYIHDIHPFNLTLHKGRFCFLDFSAISFGQATKHLLKEFVRHYINPLILCSKGEWHRVSALSYFSKVKILYKDLTGYLNPLERIEYLKYFFQFKTMLKRGSLSHTFQILKQWLLSYDLTKNPLGWSDYYKTDLLSSVKDKNKWRPKQKIIEDCLDHLRPKSIVDIAGNAGLYSYHAASRGIWTICLDNESEAINRCYQFVRENSINNLAPAVSDFIAPSLARINAPISSCNPISTPIRSLQERIGKVDLILMLALVHHLVFSQNLTFTEIVNQIATYHSEYLCIEFPTGSRVVHWLDKEKKNQFLWYNEKNFTNALEEKYQILSKIAKEEDTLFYFCRRKL